MYDGRVTDVSDVEKLFMAITMTSLVRLGEILRWQDTYPSSVTIAGLLAESTGMGHRCAKVMANRRMDRWAFYWSLRLSVCPSVSSLHLLQHTQTRARTALLA